MNADLTSAATSDRKTDALLKLGISSMDKKYVSGFFSDFPRYVPGRKMLILILPLGLVNSVMSK